MENVLEGMCKVCGGSGHATGACVDEMKIGGYLKRVAVPPELASWKVDFPGYRPIKYTDQKVYDHEGDWADSHIDPKKMKSYTGEISFNSEGKPLNPMGRTGIEGRGELGKYGPNLAADPVITKKTHEGGMAILLTLRAKEKKWAIPGGMVDKGESKDSFIEDAEKKLQGQDPVKVRQIIDGTRQVLEEMGADRTLIAALRELMEETGCVLKPEAVRRAVAKYRGFVDDPRNTDNAWMETGVWHIHIEKEEDIAFQIEHDDEGLDTQWVPLEEILDPNSEFYLTKLFASHGKILQDSIPELKRDL